MMSNSATVSKEIIYCYQAVSKRIWRRIENDCTPENFKLLKNYERQMIKESLATATINRNLERLHVLTRMLNMNWENTTKQDIEELIITVIQKYAENGQETDTTYDFKRSLKAFVRWYKLGSRSLKEVGDPDEISGIKVKKVQDKISRENLITDEELAKILKACEENQRDRALLAVHAEAGTRVGEILNLQIKHVVFDQYGAIIKVNGKTGSRQVRLIHSTPFLAKWLESHPYKDNPDSPLWLDLSRESNHEKPLTYSGATKLLKKRVRKAGIKKRINLKLFRHTEATRCASFMNEALLRKRHGWTNVSKMPSRYTHMNNEDVERALFEHYGIKKQTSEKEKLPKICSICKMPNPCDAEMCEQCGKPLDLSVAMIEEKKREEMLDRRDQRFEQALAEQAKMIEELKNKLNMGQLN